MSMPVAVLKRLFAGIVVLMLLTDLALIVIGDAKFKLLSHPLVLSALVEIILMFAAAVASNAPIAPVPALAKNTMPFPRDPFVVGEPDSPSIQIFPEPLSKVTFFCMKIPAPEVDALLPYKEISPPAVVIFTPWPNSIPFKSEPLIPVARENSVPNKTAPP